MAKHQTRRTWAGQLEPSRRDPKVAPRDDNTQIVPNNQHSHLKRPSINQAFGVWETDREGESKRERLREREGEKESKRERLREKEGGRDLELLVLEVNCRGQWRLHIEISNVHFLFTKLDSLNLLSFWTLTQHILIHHLLFIRLYSRHLRYAWIKHLRIPGQLLQMPQAWLASLLGPHGTLSPLSPGTHYAKLPLPAHLLSALFSHKTKLHLGWNSALCIL